jgi:hypothetical protein
MRGNEVESKMKDGRSDFIKVNKDYSGKHTQGH